MSAIGLHPALGKVLRYRMVAAVRRRWRALRNRNNLAATGVVVALGLVWLCGVIAAAVNREPLPADQLRGAITNGMVIYILWMFIKTAIWKPAQELSLTPEERGVLLGCPFPRRDLLVYHLARTSMTALVKTLCVGLIVFPDLPDAFAGFLGIYLAITFLELLRTLLNVAGHGAGPRAFAVFRGMILFVCGWLGLALIERFVDAGSTLQGTVVTFLFEFSNSLVNVVGELRSAIPIRILATPCSAFGNLVTAPLLLCWEGALSAAAPAGLVTAAFAGAFLLDSCFEKITRRREQMSIDRLPSNLPSRSARIDNASIQLSPAAFCGGIGPLVWRQWRSAKRCRLQVLALCLPPAFFSLMPLASRSGVGSPEYLVAGLLGFFTFLLFCPTVKYDFRRDFSRLGLLKGLPLRPMTVVAGQLCVPVLLATGMQLATLTICLGLDPTPAAAGRILLAMFVLVPWNIFVFGLENLIFLTDPHHEDQTGLEMFVRTTLVFTAKSLLLGLGLLGLILWVPGARHCTQFLQVRGFDVWFGTVFCVGLWLVIVCAACVAVVFAEVAFERLDTRAINHLDD